MNDRRARALKGGAFAALVLLGTCSVLRARRPAPLPAPDIAISSAVAPAPPENGERSASRRASEVAPAAPVIDSITVEKNEVCEGEENLVTVRAHTPDGNDAFLHYQIGSDRGSPAALRSYLDDRGRPTAHRISVFGKNNVATSAEVPSFRVKRCNDAPALIIEHRLRPNTVAEFDFDARIVRMGTTGADGGSPPSFRARRFVWSFGDGTVQEGREPHETHSFATRPQDTLYSQFLVTVKALGDDGRELEGRRAIELLNPAFEAFAYKGIVQLFADLDPRFPVMTADGKIDQGIRLWHTRTDAVPVNKVTVATRRIDGHRSPPAHPPVGSVLGGAVIPPGRGLELHVVLDTRAEPDTLSRDYFLEGQTIDGHPVRGAFSIMRPPIFPSKDRHVPISDPQLVAKVKMARDILHREYVTDDDLFALERAGKFDELRFDGGAAAASPSSSATRPSLN